MKKSGAFIKNNYHYFVFFLFVIITFIICQFVNLSILDDLTYYTIAKAGIKEIFSFLKWHYFNQNARLLVHLLEMLTLGFNLNVWRVLNTLTMGVLVFTTAKNIECKSIDFKAALIGSSLFYTCVDFEFLRPTVYWISASFNYLFPMTIVSLFIFVYKKNRKSALLPILALIAAISMEQVAAIIFGLIVLLCAKSLIHDKKINSVSLVISLIASFAGILYFVLAPVTSNRYDTEKSELPFIKGFVDSLYNIQLMENWFSRKSLLIIILISVSTVFLLFYIQKSKGTYKGIYSLIAAALTVLTAADIISDLIMPLGVIKVLYIAVLFAAEAVVCIALIVKEKQWLPLMALVLGCGSQIMMAFVDLRVSRTMFTGMVCFSYYVIYAITLMYKSVKRPFRAVMLTLAVLLSVYNLYGGVPKVQTLLETVYYSESFSPDNELIEEIKEKGMYDEKFVHEIAAKVEASRK